MNADDFGMFNSVNLAIFGVLEEGLVCSTTVMMPCPWALALYDMEFLKNHPKFSFGVHFTVIFDWIHYRWSSLTATDLVPS
jgi:predicted glycoside hydrolase/deacetylase ChbG (UPF0249 family)